MGDCSKSCSTSTLSLCIPRIIDEHVNAALLYKIFSSYNWGCISRIDLIKKKYNRRAFIHFKYWHNDDKTLNIKNKLLNGGVVNIIYNYKNGWFWKCSASRLPMLPKYGKS